MTRFTTEVYPETIAKALFKAANITPKSAQFEEIEDAIYAAMARAENEYNNDYHRALYRLFEKIADAQGIW